MKTLKHSRQQPQFQKLTKRSQQSDRQSEQCSLPPKGPFFTDSWSWMKSSSKLALSNQQAQLQKLRLVTLTENAAITLSRLLVWLLLICTLHCTYYCLKNQL